MKPVKLNIRKLVHIPIEQWTRWHARVDDFPLEVIYQEVEFPTDVILPANELNEGP